MTVQRFGTGATPAAVRLAHEEPKAFEHEHLHLYVALEQTAQIAELTAHDRLARVLRDYRRAIAGELDTKACSERPADVGGYAGEPSTSVHTARNDEGRSR